MADATRSSSADSAERVADRLIGLASPVLDLILAIGDRVSRLAEPNDYEYYPIRPESERQLPTPDAESGADAES